ncbi:hypothetical protein [Limnohabitans sp. DM1]|uniref:hypothetical protein n=1 Tax=Limnohabitans sp. DM1 TaxID=1597955 RepID=UPI001E575634|nr:hypothetical protein [Limnohabitans sp. DM1]
MNALAPSASRWHQRMWGALLVKRLPVLGRPSLSLEQAPQGLFLLWLAFMGLLVFGAAVMWQHGLWHRLVQADPTGLTIVIVLLFIGCSVWAGLRCWALGLQWQALQSGGAMATAEQASWAHDYLQARGHAHTDKSILLQVLSDRAHGPQEMAWWLNGIQLKLGLLGKVIGFSVLALELGRMDGFDPQQSAQMLKSLTGGLGIALLTTITGLAANILLGLQLMRIDRFADGLVAEILTLGEAQAMQPAGTGAAE